MNLPFIYKRADSRWWWYSWNDPVKKFRRRGSCKPLGLPIDMPREQALDRVLEFLEMKPSSPSPGAESLGWFRGFFNVRSDPNITDSTRSLYFHGFGLFTEMFGDDFPLRDVRRIPHVARFQDFLLNSGRSPVTVNIICRSVQAVFRRAFDLGFIEFNPFTRFPRIREPTDQIKYLQADEVSRLLAAVRDWAPVSPRKPAIWYEGMKRLMLIYLYTARRRDEVLAIRREDIDLDHRVLCILNSKKRGRPHDVIDIPEPIRAHLEWFMAAYPGDRPFRAYSSWAVDRYFKIWLRAAGLPDNFHLHNLRHTALSLAANQPDANIRAIQQFVGHSTITMTERYIHGRSRGRINLGKEFTLEGDKTGEQ